LKIKGKDWLWVAPLLVIVALVVLPIDWSNTVLGDWLNDQWSWITKTGAGVVTFLSGIIAKVKQTVDQFSPVVNKVLAVKEEYDAAIQEGTSNHQQDL